MGSVGDRLCEERARLRLNQTEFGKIAGVKTNTQSNYEKGLRRPDTEYLSRLAAEGVDVQYVITGVRSPNAPPNASLTRPEEVLVEKYRLMSPEDQKRFQAVVGAFSDEGNSAGELKSA